MIYVKILLHVYKFVHGFPPWFSDSLQLTQRPEVNLPSTRKPSGGCIYPVFSIKIDEQNENLASPWYFPAVTCISYSMHQQQDVLVYLSSWPGAIQRRPGALRKKTTKMTAIYSQHSTTNPTTQQIQIANDYMDWLLTISIDQVSLCFHLCVKHLCYDCNPQMRKDTLQ